MGSDHVTSKIKVHDSKDDNNYSNGLANNIIKDVKVGRGIIWYSYNKK